MSHRPCQPPLPKGGWHGIAVTGGFLSRADVGIVPYNPAVGVAVTTGTGEYRIRPYDLASTLVAFPLRGRWPSVSEVG